MDPEKEELVRVLIGLSDAYKALCEAGGHTYHLSRASWYAHARYLTCQTKDKPA
jgi:hypothetical protein